jgi:hypothetical protein
MAAIPFSIPSIFAFSLRTLTDTAEITNSSVRGRPGLLQKVTSSIAGFWKFAAPRPTSGKILPGLAGVEGGRGKARYGLEAPSS